MNPTPTSTDAWSVVCRRRRSGNKPPAAVPNPHPQTLTPSPWSPSDPATSPARESRLLNLLNSSLRRLAASHFYRRFLSRLRSPPIHRPLSALSPLTILIYGIGSIESYPTPRLQLALALLLRRDLPLPAPAVQIFDPVLSAAECAVLQSLNCTVLNHNEQCRRVVDSPTLFYMPHCEAVMYDNLLRANWRPEGLGRMVVLGNSFGEYARYVEGMGGGGGSVRVGMEARHVLEVRKYVREVGMEGEKTVGAYGEVEDDDDDGFFRAFHDMSWHFFELDGATTDECRAEEEQLAGLAVEEKEGPAAGEDLLAAPGRGREGRPGSMRRAVDGAWQHKP